MGKDDTIQDMCEICCRFKDADQIFDISPCHGQTISVCADCLSTIYSGGSHGSKRKDLDSIELYNEYISGNITFAELGRKYSCDDKTIRYRIIRVHEQLKNHYGRYDINLVGAINLLKPSVEMQLARRGIVNVVDLMSFVSQERLSNIKGITRATEGYILKDLSVRSNQLRKEILEELLDIYEKQHDGILPLTIIVSRKEYKVMVHSSKKYDNKTKLALQYKRDSICVQDKFYISCNDDLYDPYNPLTAATKEAKHYIYKKGDQEI